MKSVIDGNCTLCFGKLYSPIYIIDNDLLDHLQFLNNHLDVNLIRKSSICATCVKSVREAQNFKTLYLLTADSPPRKKKKETISREEIELEELKVCRICKSFEHYCLPISDIIEEDKLTKIIDSLSLEGNPLSCGSCQNALTNLGNILIFLAIYNKSEDRVILDDLNINVNQLPTTKNLNPEISAKKVKPEIKKEKFKISDKVDSELPSSSSTNRIGSVNKIEKEDIKINKKNLVSIDNEVQTDSLHLNLRISNCETVKEEIDEVMIIEDSESLENKQTTEEKEFEDNTIENKLQWISNSESVKEEIDEIVITEESLENKQTTEEKEFEDNTKENKYLKLQWSFNEVDVETNQRRKKDIYRCIKCSFESTYKAKVKEHLLSHYDNGSLFSCSICDFMTDHHDYLQCHLLIHKMIVENKIPQELAKDLLLKKHIDAISS